MTAPLDRHWDWVDRIYSAPVEDRAEMVCEELEEFIAEVRAGTVRLPLAIRWTDNPFAPGTLSLDFTRHPAAYGG